MLSMFRTDGQKTSSGVPTHDSQIKLPHDGLSARVVQEQIQMMAEHLWNLDHQVQDLIKSTGNCDNKAANHTAVKRPDHTSEPTYEQVCRQVQENQFLLQTHGSMLQTQESMIQELGKELNKTLTINQRRLDSLSESLLEQRVKKLEEKRVDVGSTKVSIDPDGLDALRYRIEALSADVSQLKDGEEARVVSAKRAASAVPGLIAGLFGPRMQALLADSEEAAERTTAENLVLLGALRGIGDERLAPELARIINVRQHEQVLQAEEKLKILNERLVEIQRLQDQGRDLAKMRSAEQAVKKEIDQLHREISRANEQDTDETMALRNFERFHQLEPGTATIDQVRESRRGVHGWAAVQANTFESAEGDELGGDALSSIQSGANVVQPRKTNAGFLKRLVSPLAPSSR